MVINANTHAHEGYSTHFVCVCVCVCPPFSGSKKPLPNTLISAIVFVLNAKDLQFKDFSEKAYFKSYSIFHSDMAANL